MCGIVGFVNYKQDISKYRNVLINMNNTLSNRGPDEQGFYVQNRVALAHKRLIVIDPEGGKQPMIASSYMTQKEPSINSEYARKNRYKIITLCYRL